MHQMHVYVSYEFVFAKKISGKCLRNSQKTEWLKIKVSPGARRPHISPFRNLNFEPSEGISYSKQISLLFFFPGNLTFVKAEDLSRNFYLLPMT